MEHLMHSSLASLANDLSFKVEKITPLDFYYTDGTACGSFLKLVLERNKTITAVYFFPSGTYYATNFLSQEETSILNGWVAMVKSQKIEHS